MMKADETARDHNIYHFTNKQPSQIICKQYVFS